MQAATLLRTSRKQAGLTQRDLALRTGMPQSTVARIERGQNDPRAGTLNALLAGCGQVLTGSGLSVSSPFGFSERARRYLPEMIRRIAQRFDPVLIVLFGSQANGRARPDSDVDLVVVFDSLSDKRRMRVAIREALADLPIDKDILVATAGEISNGTGGLMLAKAMEKGIPVYGR